MVGPPRVLVVSQNDDESRYLVQALTEQGLTVDLARPDGLPTGVAALVGYNSVILDDVPATQLSPSRMDALQSYVRDLGRGLIAVGGPDAYGPGGYFQTPLEETLPVDMQIRDQQRLPQITILYVIDRSGSMASIGSSGVQNIDLAKEAIIRSLDFLQSTDRAGVLSFDTDGIWIAEPQPVLDRLGLQAQVATLRASGGTDILAGMRMAAEAMRQEPSQRKHIILLTDGGSSKNGLLELTTELNQQDGVTTSVIAIGAGAAPFLEDMAAAGGGNYHVADAVESIPTIFTQETVLATRSYIIEKAVRPDADRHQPDHERHQQRALAARLRGDDRQADGAGHPAHGRRLQRPGAGGVAVRLRALGRLHQRRDRPLVGELGQLGGFRPLLESSRPLDDHRRHQHQRRGAGRHGGRASQAGDRRPRRRWRLPQRAAVDHLAAGSRRHGDHADACSRSRRGATRRPSIRPSKALTS